MNKKWLQQGTFVARVKEFCRKNALLTPRGAVKLDIVADMFNLTEDTLRQFLQNTSRKRPHYDTLAYIAGVIGCSVTEFMDDPGDPPQGMSHEKWTDMSERERVLASAMLSDIAADELSIAEKEELFRAYKEAKERILRLRDIIANCKTLVTNEHRS